MNKIKYGTEFLDQLKDKVHELQWEIERLNKELTIRIQNSQYLVKQQDELEEEIERLKREKDIVIKLNHFLNYEVKRILKDNDLSHIEKLQEISKVLEGVDKE